MITSLPARDKSACPEVPAPVVGQPTDVDSPEHPCCAARGADPVTRLLARSQRRHRHRETLGVKMHSNAWHRQPTRPRIPHPKSRPARLLENKQTQEVIDGSLWKTLITWL